MHIVPPPRILAHWTQPCPGRNLVLEPRGALCMHNARTSLAKNEAQAAIIAGAAGKVVTVGAHNAACAAWSTQAQTTLKLHLCYVAAAGMAQLQRRWLFHLAGGSRGDKVARL